MQISRTITARRATLKVQKEQEAPSYRPTNEEWRVGSQTLSTEELFSSDEVTPAGVPTEYSFKHQITPKRGETRTTVDTASDVVTRAAYGSLAGAALPFGLALGGSCLEAIANFSLAPKIPSLPVNFLLGAAVIGGAIGAVSGLRGSELEVPELTGNLKGTLRKERLENGDRTIAFYPGGDLGARLDLQGHKDAKHPPFHEKHEGPIKAERLKTGMRATLIGVGTAGVALAASPMGIAGLAVGAGLGAIAGFAGNPDSYKTMILSAQNRSEVTDQWWCAQTQHLR